MNYSIWITIRISHAYFKQWKCGIDLQPTTVCRQLLDKAGILFRKQDATTWILLKNKEDERQPNRASLIFESEKSQLDFNLITSPEFSYITQWSREWMKGKQWVLRNQRDQCKGKKYLQVIVSPALANETLSVDISIPSRKVGLEFILIPKHSSAKGIYELREDNNKLTFSQLESTLLPGVEKAFSCMATESVTLQEGYNYRISLWEKKENGELLLSTHIPFPHPTALSASNPKERISSYFYF